MRYIMLVLLLLIVLQTMKAAGSSTSPLSPPSADELRTAVSIMRADSRFPAKARFICMGLAEPNKRDFYDTVRRRTMQREIRSTVYDYSSNHAYEFFVNVDTRTVSEVRVLHGMQPLLTMADYDSSEAIIRRSPRFHAAVGRLGVDAENVSVESWATGIPNAPSQRLVRVLFYVKDSQGVNRYDRPIEGLSALVNLAAGTIMQWQEPPDIVIPAATSTYPIPLNVDAPIQSGLTTPVMKSDEVQWRNWRFVPIMHPREGLTLYNVRWSDGSTERRVAWRISLSEMLVPYGDTANTWTWRNAFDVGEYGFGHLSTPLRKGADVPAQALLRSANFVNDNGSIVLRKDVMALYERDVGIGWRHAASATVVASQHARELVVQHAATIANYDYVISYVFGMDGTITADVGLTGLMLVRGSKDTVYDAVGTSGQMYAHMVARNVLAPTHQHFFNFRIDLDVDDTANVVTELDLRSPPAGLENPLGNAIMVDEWDLRSEKEAVRSVSIPNARTWRVSSKRKNNIGIPTAYTLVPGPTALPFLQPQSYVRKRARFIENQLYVTRFKPTELYAAGEFPNQSEEGKGLPEYQMNDERLIRRDVVLWYTMGVNHLARPEDWPVMPTAHATFKLVPTGFFSRNPMLEK